VSEPTDPTSTTAAAAPAGTATSSAASAKPTAAATSSAHPAPDPSAAAEYTTEPEVVTAVQYTAPDGADEPGNIDEIESLGLQVDKQDPWDPAGGQNCLLVGYPAEGEHELPVRFLVQPGQYVVTRPGANAFEVYHPEDFTEKYSPTK
jgi:hypothetical protein